MRIAIEVPSPHPLESNLEAASIWAGEVCKQLRLTVGVKEPLRSINGYDLALDLCKDFVVMFRPVIFGDQVNRPQ